MKASLLGWAGLIAMGVFGCAAEPTQEETAIADDELRSSFGATDAIRCSVESDETTLALVRTQSGKAALLSLEPAADVYALSRKIGSVTTSRGISWKGTSSTVTLGSNMKGTWERGTKTADVTCKKVAAAEAASWRTANALADYADQIDGIAEAVLEYSEDPHPKPYTVFVVETSRRSSLALGNIASQTGGSVKASNNADDEYLLDENDFSYGAMCAAYSLGGGDDYGEWFQGASDGVSLNGEVTPALGSTAVAGYIAREKVTALASLVGHANPSAVEITVGPWTFFLPGSFAE